MTAMLTDEERAKLVALEKAATPGPWKKIPQGGSSTVTTQERPGRNDTRIPGYAYRDDEHCLAYPFIEDDGRTRLDFVCFSHADAALIAATRNALPALLAADAAVRGMREALEKAAEQFEFWARELRKRAASRNHFPAHGSYTMQALSHEQSAAECRSALAAIEKATKP